MIDQQGYVASTRRQASIHFADACLCQGHSRPALATIEKGPVGLDANHPFRVDQRQVFGIQFTSPEQGNNRQELPTSGAGTGAGLLQGLSGLTQARVGNLRRRLPGIAIHRRRRGGDRRRGGHRMVAGQQGRQRRPGQLQLFTRHQQFVLGLGQGHTGPQTLDPGDLPLGLQTARVGFMQPQAFRAAFVYLKRFPGQCLTKIALHQRHFELGAMPVHLGLAGLESEPGGLPPRLDTSTQIHRLYRLQRHVDEIPILYAVVARQSERREIHPGLPDPANQGITDPTDIRLQRRVQMAVAARELDARQSPCISLGPFGPTLLHGGAGCLQRFVDGDKVLQCPAKIQRQRIGLLPCGNATPQQPQHRQELAPHGVNPLPGRRTARPLQTTPIPHRRAPVPCPHPGPVCGCLRLH